MCGIIGGWTGERMDRMAIEQALAQLVHRGPDSRGIFENDGVFLGIQRLAIIDVDGGTQPIFNEDGSLAVVCNGEIYNYLELMEDLISRQHTFRTHSDTEVLVHLYEEFGERMVEHLRGMFSFAIWDGRKRCLFLGRDRFGKKPLFYTRTRAGGILFASELKALRPLATQAGAQWSVRPQAIYDYVSLAAVPQPDTIFEEVQMMPPASSLTFDGQRLEQRCYWRMEYAPKTAASYEEALEQTRELIAESIQIRLRSDVPVAVFLSGGIDSSVIAYEIARAGGTNLQTFTVAAGGDDLDESPVAARTAQALGIKNTVLPLQLNPLETLKFLAAHFDQPFADSSAIPTFEISRMARQHVKVVLNGDGGDELFAGYRRCLAAYQLHQLEWVPKSLFRSLARLMKPLDVRRRSSLGFYARFVRGMGCGVGERYLTWTSDMLFEREKKQLWKGSSCRSTESWIESVVPSELAELEAQLYADIRINLLSVLLVKMDMATMAASIESRSPFMDHKLFEFTAHLPGRYLLSRGRTKSMLRDAYRGRISDEVINAPKRGFEVPLANWLQNEFHELLFDTVGSKTALVRTYFGDQFIDSLLAKKCLADRNWAYLVYALLVLELWLRALPEKSGQLERNNHTLVGCPDKDIRA
ncbi:MAG: asparagine synthase (glutamine-hydrolyzing) [Verrucomicrobia bacterium]|nr:asparagine synthase (glutamine-hydrolyzing) [Verrucomicrobiota bacterium]